METAFVGRELELQLLQEFTKRPQQSLITVLYGRRRIGKTRLVLEACRGFRVLHFEGLEGAGSAKQREHFLKTLYRQSGESAHRLAKGADWVDLLTLLAEYVAGQPTVIFFDEFQWMAAGRSDLVTRLKYVWDNLFKKNGCVHLILCGSVSSFLMKKVVHSHALYGRIDRTVNLQALEFREARRGFFMNRSALEALEFYLAFGGIPKYLELYESNRSVRLAMERLCFEPGAYFIDEFDRLFTSHFGKNTHYRSTVEYLASRGSSSREEIAKHIGMKLGGRMTEILEDLTLAGFIETHGSVRNPKASRLKRFRIIDPFLRFHFNFIKPASRRIMGSRQGVPLQQALPDKLYSAYLGLAFEGFCRQHSHRIAQRLGFSSVSYECGSWFKRGEKSPGAQIDLLYRRADNVFTLCEVKHRRKVGLEVIEEVERKVDVLRAETDRTIERVLISAEAPQAQVVDAGYFAEILTVDDFL